MPHYKPSAECAENGKAHAQMAITRDLRWIFRNQPENDYGIDAHAEVVDNGTVTGRLLGLQVKGGTSWFREPHLDGWWFRPDDQHVSYWLAHSLPVAVVLFHPDSERCYWQLIDRETLVRTSTEGWKLLVPRSHILDESAANRLGKAAADTAFRRVDRVDVSESQSPVPLSPLDIVEVRDDRAPFLEDMRRKAKDDPAEAVTEALQWIESKLRRGLKEAGLEQVDDFRLETLIVAGMEMGAYDGAVVDALWNIPEMYTELAQRTESLNQQGAERDLHRIGLLSGMLSSVFATHQLAVLRRQGRLSY